MRKHVIVKSVYFMGSVLIQGYMAGIFCFVLPSITHHLQNIPWLIVQLGFSLYL